MLRVEGYKNLYRDDSGAIVNTDTQAYSNYLKMKEQKKKQKDEIEKMKEDIDEIKSLLKELINGSKWNWNRIN